MKLLTTLLLFASFSVAPLHAATPVKTTFTPREQQQISVSTPGLFDQKNRLTIDFTNLPEADFSFPLPVGKVVRRGNALQTDIVTTPGDAVKAAFAGTVRLSKAIGGHGNVIVIRHDNGLETVYAHNAQNLVASGDRVKAGQTIAIVGGMGKEAFCRFTIMANGSRINPATVIDLNAHRLRKQVLTLEKKGNSVRVSVARATENKQSETTEKEAVATTPPTSKTNLNLAEIPETEWAYPLPGAKVISPYGGRRRHAGVDLKTRPNDKILAAFPGVVTQSGPYFGYGNFIVIRHENGLETRYSHQSKNLVKKGDRVKAGDVIGLTGRTGRATTEHLHFEVAYKGRRMNPNVIFNHVSQTLKKVTLTLLGGSLKVL